jgi:hypothetical protein
LQCGACGQSWPITDNITVVDEHRWLLLEQGLGGESYASKEVRGFHDIVFARVADRG